MPTFHLSSILPDAYLDDLETLLYFNPRQRQFRQAILASVEKYGPPRIRTSGGCLRLTVDGVTDVQALYAFARSDAGDELAGVALYTREADNLVVLHVAVADAFSAGGDRDDDVLALKLLTEIRQIARRLKGIEAVVFYAPSGGVSRMRLASASGRQQ